MNFIIRGLIFILTAPGNVFLSGTVLLSSAYMVIPLARHQRKF
jgi:hypothetical protein